MFGGGTIGHEQHTVCILYAAYTLRDHKDHMNHMIWYCPCGMVNILSIDGGTRCRWKLRLWQRNFWTTKFIWWQVRWSRWNSFLKPLKIQLDCEWCFVKFPWKAREYYRPMASFTLTRYHRIVWLWHFLFSGCKMCLIFHEISGTHLKLTCILKTLNLCLLHISKCPRVLIYTTTYVYQYINIWRFPQFLWSKCELRPSARVEVTDF